jgi:NAD(P)-dependent dehydrogenase (short-subunit alcohol dehydrogenase family)
MGREMALAFAAAGSRVAVADVESSAAAATAELIYERGGEAITIRADVTVREDIETMVDAALSAFGRIDVLVNHAGHGDNALLDETDDALWDHSLALHLTAPFLTSRRVLPGMIMQGGGVILNTISTAGVRGGRAGPSYTAAKHGLVGLTRNIAATYARRGIRCVGISPGSVRSDPLLNPRTQPRPEFADVLALSPRVGHPSEIAALAVFLASDQASFVNGAIIAADGGAAAI